jgi:hypothetical protein
MWLSEAAGLAVTTMLAAVVLVGFGLVQTLPFLLELLTQ